MRASVLLLLAVGCADFPSLDRGVCGNKIVEAGEDCDDPGDERCTKPGSLGACRRICDPDDPTPDCAPGQVCGDGICRSPSDGFDPDPLVIMEEGALWLEVGDFDGDGRHDLAMQFDEPDLKLAFIAPPLEFDLVSLAEGIVGLPAVGDLTGDDADDLFVVHEATSAEPNAVSLWRGAVGTHQPRLAYFATLTNVGADSRLLSPTPAPDRILELLDENHTKHWSSGAVDAVDVDPIGIDGKDLGTHVAVRDIDGGECSNGAVFPRQEIALAVQGEHSVQIASTCGGTSPFEFLPEVQLPAGTAGAAGAFFAQAEGDTNLDLFVQTADGRVLIAHGAGDGTFHSEPGITDGQFSATPVLGMGTAQLRAVANFDLDPQLEFVTDEHYYPCVGDGCTRVAWEYPMSSAVVVDINADGVLDLAGADEDGLVLRLGAPEAAVHFNEHRVDVAGPVRNLVVGDFNRDSVEDVAYVEVDDEAAVAAESVTIVFGAPGQGADPQWTTEPLGPFIEIRDLVAEATGSLVARTVDAGQRAAGAFIHRGSPAHTFGRLAHAPHPVTLGEDRTVAAIGASPGEGSESMTHFGFVGGSLSPHDIAAGSALAVEPGDGALLISVPIDLDANGFDELVTLGPDRGWISHFDAGTRAWHSTELTHGLVFLRRPVSPEHPMFDARRPGSVATPGDADGDGDVDIVATTDGILPGVVVFRNDGGTLGADPIVLTNPNKPGFVFAHIEAWHTTPDGVQRWLVAGREGVGIADIDLESREILVSDIDDIADQPVALATGDVDGDGLLDLILATRNDVRVHLAVEQVGRTE